MLLVITVGCIPKASRMLFHLVVFTTARGAGPMAILLWHIMKCNNRGAVRHACGATTVGSVDTPARDAARFLPGLDTRTS